jgi:hypothetical protein
LLKFRNEIYDRENELSQREFENKMSLSQERRMLSGERRATAEEKRHQSRFEREEAVGRELQSIFDSPPMRDEVDPISGETTQVIDPQRRNQMMAAAMTKLRTAAGNAAAIKMLQDEPMNAREIHELFGVPMPQARQIAKRSTFDDQTKLYAQIDRQEKSKLQAQRESRIEARSEADLAIKERTRTEVERHNRVLEGRESASERREAGPTERIKNLERRRKELLDSSPLKSLGKVRKEQQAEFDAIESELRALRGTPGGTRQSVAPLETGEHKVTVAPSSDRIRVRDKATGRTGTILANEFDPKKYEKVK